MARDYDRRYQSVRGYAALVRILPEADRPEAVDTEADLDAEIRKSLAAQISQPTASLWVFAQQDSKSKDDGGDDKSDQVALEDPEERGRDDQQPAKERKESVEPPFEQIDRSTGAQIHEWRSIRHFEMMHRQGLHAPSLVLSFIEQGRPFYKASYRESQSDDKLMPFLFIRQKQHRLKFRISSDAEKMQKFLNPHYAGKCTVRVCDADRIICRVLSHVSGLIAIITITTKSAKHHVRVELMGELLNWEESGPSGLVMSGHVNNYLDPILILRMENSSRAVLEIRKSGRAIPAPNETLEHQPHAMVYLDYPLNLFLSAVIYVMVDSRRRGLGMRK